MARFYSEGWFFEQEFADGTINRLDLTAGFVLSQSEGLGSIPVEYYTQQAALGDGIRISGYSLGERNLIFTIVSLGNYTLEERDEKRMRLLDFARPNQYKPVKAVVTKANGKRYFISIYPAEGAAFTPDSFANANFQEPTTWISYNPIWYEYDKVVYELPLTLPDAPTSANIGYTATARGSDVTFTFTVAQHNRAGGDVKYLYNFGDGDFSTYQNVVHRYPAAGTYRHRLTIYNEVGSYSSALGSISVR